MQITLDIVPNAPPAEVYFDEDTIVMPSVPGQFASLLQTVQQLLVKLEGLPFEQIGDSLAGSLRNIEALTSAPEVAASLASLQATLEGTQTVVRRLDEGLSPALRALPGLISSLQTAVTQANRLISSANRGYGDESQLHRDLGRLVEQITGAARSLRSLTDTLNRNPESLIRGRATGGQ
jgi:paraquat-inducible protein B